MLNLMPDGRRARYTHSVKSVADQLRGDTRARVLRLPMAARIELSLQLGDDDVASYAAYAGLELDEARRRLRTRRAHGRAFSRAARPEADDAPQSGR
jgi:hypothetical protein